MTFLETNSAPQILQFMPKCKVRFQEGGDAIKFHEIFHNFLAKSHDTFIKLLTKAIFEKFYMFKFSLIPSKCV